MNSMDESEKSTSDADKISWPVLIKYQSDDGLVLLDSLAQWHQDHIADDYLQLELAVDSEGRILGISNQGLAIKRIDGKEQSFSIGQLERLVRTHAAHEGHCCSAKMHINEFTEGFEMIRVLGDS